MSYTRPTSILIALTFLTCTFFSTCIGSAQDLPNRYQTKLRVTAMPSDELLTDGRLVDDVPKAVLKLRSEPKYRSKQPLRYSIQIGAAKDDIYAMVLDSSSGSSVYYDTLYIDTNQDHILEETEKLTLAPNITESKRFGPIKLMVNCEKEGKKDRCPQYIAFRIFEFIHVPDAKKRRLIPKPLLEVVNCGYYLTKVRVGNAQKTIAFVDWNNNGIFNDVFKNEDDTDRVITDLDKYLATHSYEERSSLLEPLGQFVQIEGAFYQIEVAPDGADVKFTPSTESVGRVVGYGHDFQLIVSGDKGILKTKSVDGKANLPRGEYQILAISYTAKTPDGANWTFSARTEGNSKKFIVRKDEETKLVYGPPFSPQVRGHINSGRYTSLSMQIIGSGGEIYNAVNRNNTDPPVATVRVLNPSDKELTKLTLPYG